MTCALTYRGNKCWWTHGKVVQFEKLLKRWIFLHLRQVKHSCSSLNLPVHRLNGRFKSTNLWNPFVVQQTVPCLFNVNANDCKITRQVQPEVKDQNLFQQKTKLLLLYTAAMIQAHPQIPYFHTFSPIQQCPPYTSHDHPPLLLTWPLDPTCHFTWLLTLDKAKLTACILYLNKPRQRYSLAFLVLLTSQKNRTLAYNIMLTKFIARVRAFLRKSKPILRRQLKPHVFGNIV